MLTYDRELYSCYMAYKAYVDSGNLTLQTYRGWRHSTDLEKEAFVKGWMARREYGVEPGYEGDVESLKEL